MSAHDFAGRLTHYGDAPHCPKCSSFLPDDFNHLRDDGDLLSVTCKCGRRVAVELQIERAFRCVDWCRCDPKDWPRGIHGTPPPCGAFVANAEALCATCWHESECHAIGAQEPKP